MSDSEKNQSEGARVLVVDDNRALAAVVAESLEHVDDRLTVTYTTDPEQALEELSDGVDCLVTDYEMPELDGLALVDEDATGTPFVLYTQRPAERLPEGVHERGGEYLHKETGTEQYRRLARLVHEQVRN